MYFWDLKRSDAESKTGHGKLLLTLDDVAQRFSLGRATVHQMIARNELRVVRIGRAIPLRELERKE